MRRPLRKNSWRLHRTPRQGRSLSWVCCCSPGMVEAAAISSSCSSSLRRNTALRSTKWMRNHPPGVAWRRSVACRDYRESTLIWNWSPGAGQPSRSCASLSDTATINQRRMASVAEVISTNPLLPEDEIACGGAPVPVRPRPCHSGTWHIGARIRSWWSCVRRQESSFANAGAQNA